jgi:acetoin utilization protein AcuB
MNLEDVAKTRVHTVPPEERIDKAIALMEAHDIHHLPVVSQGAIVGMLSDRDILTAVGGLSSAERRLPGQRVAGPERVADIMSKPVRTLAPGDTIRLATRLMIHERIHAIPLVRGDKLVGIVTEVDLLEGILRSAEFTASKPPLAERPIRSFVAGHLTTAGPRTSLDELVDLMLNAGIRHLPIVVERELLGIISDRDVRAALGQEAVQDQQAQASGRLFIGTSAAAEIMRTDVKTIGANASLGQAVDALLRNRIHCLPVLDAGAVVAIITDTDILRVLGDLDMISADSTE